MSLSNISDPLATSSSADIDISSQDQSLYLDSFYESDRKGLSSKEKSSKWHPYSLDGVPCTKVAAFSPNSSSASTATGRPTVPYAQLISEAIRSTSNGKITLNGIYSYVVEKYPYFQTASVGWKNSVRHNLSLNKSFVRVPRPPTEKGKGAYWTFSQEKDKSNGSAPSKSSSSSSSKKSKAQTASGSPRTLRKNVSPKSGFLQPMTGNFDFSFASSFNPSGHSISPFRHSYQNDEFLTNDSYISTSQQTYISNSNDFENVGLCESIALDAADKSMYLDHFDKMLSIEQIRQSSQTSIDTFQTYEGSLCDSNLFYDSANNAFESIPGTEHQGYAYEDYQPDPAFWPSSDFFNNQ